MTNCDFYKYDGKDCCIIKTEIKGQESDRINSDVYKNFCKYDEGYKTCPFYKEYVRNR